MLRIEPGLACAVARTAQASRRFGLTFGATRRRWRYSQRCTNCSASSAIPSARSTRAIAAEPGFVMAHVLEGLSLRPGDRARGDGGRQACHEAARRLCRRRRASGRMSRRSAISPAAAGTKPGRISRTSPSNSRATRWRCRPATRSISSPAMRACCATASRAPCRPGRSGHARLPRHARHAGLRARGDGRLCRAPRRWPRGDRARAARRLGAARGRPCHGNAEPAAGRHRLDARQSRGAGREDSFLQVHNWWHLALFHYDLGEIDEVLALYDGPIYGKRSTLALNMVDASAILWRLHLGGVDVGDRWAALAANWRRRPAPATTPSTMCTR